MRDFLAEDVVRRRHVLAVVQRVYESFGFMPLETPTIENLSTLLGKYGPEGDQLLYRLLHRRDKLTRALDAGASSELDLAAEGLRYDLTVPLARVVANLLGNALVHAPRSTVGLDANRKSGYATICVTATAATTEVRITTNANFRVESLAM